MFKHLLIGLLTISLLMANIASACMQIRMYETQATPVSVKHTEHPCSEMPSATNHYEKECPQNDFACHDCDLCHFYHPLAFNNPEIKFFSYSATLFFLPLVAVPLLFSPPHRPPII